MRLIITPLVLCSLVTGCSLVTVEQKAFPPLAVQAERPPAPEPKVVLTASSIKINDKVQFALNSADLLPASYPLLNEVAKVIKDNPQIAVIQVEGHTDNSGKHDYNMRLSMQRAASVRAYLVNQGIDPNRLVPKGFGPDKPITTNGTEAGREKNRRVEFNILKQGPKKTAVTED